MGRWCRRPLSGPCTNPPDTRTSSGLCLQQPPPLSHSGWDRADTAPKGPSTLRVDRNSLGRRNRTRRHRRAGPRTPRGRHTVAGQPRQWKNESKREHSHIEHIKRHSCMVANNHTCVVFIGSALQGHGEQEAEAGAGATVPGMVAQLVHVPPDSNVPAGQGRQDLPARQQALIVSLMRPAHFSEAGGWGCVGPPCRTSRVSCVSCVTPVDWKREKDGTTQRPALSCCRIDVSNTHFLKSETVFRTCTAPEGCGNCP